MQANLADLVAASAERRPGHVAIIDSQRRTTYAGLDAAIDSFAAGLAAAGIEPGDRVSMLLPNRTEFVVAYFGALRMGAVASPLNTSLAVSEIAYALDHIKPRLLLADTSLRAIVSEALPDGTSVLYAGTTQWANFAAAGREHPKPEVPQDPSALAVLLFTAGSTGRPQAAMLTHGALLSNIEDLLELDRPPAMQADDIALGVLPLSHVYSLNSVLGLTMAAGATLVLEERFAARHTLDLVEQENISVIAGAPPLYIAWSAEPDLRQKLAGVRLMVSGSAPLPPAVFEQYASGIGQPIWEGYGLTECGPVVATTLVSGRPKAGSVGRPLPGVEVMLVDRGGDPVEDGTGEVYVRGASLFSGYWPDGRGGPDSNGWFATGDMATVDDEGDLRLVDRRTDLILVSGFNVYPREVERVIEELPGVAEVAVIGVSHPYSGEAVKAYVVPMPGWDVSVNEVLSHCEQRLARFKCPTIVQVVEQLPHTSVGKVARGKLRESSSA